MFRGYDGSRAFARYVFNIVGNDLDGAHELSHRDWYTGVIFAALLYAWDNSFKALNVIRTIETSSDGTESGVSMLRGIILWNGSRV